MPTAHGTISRWRNSGIERTKKDHKPRSCCTHGEQWSADLSRSASQGLVSQLYEGHVSLAVVLGACQQGVSAIGPVCFLIVVISRNTDCVSVFFGLYYRRVSQWPSCVRDTSASCVGGRVSQLCWGRVSQWPSVLSYCICKLNTCFVSVFNCFDSGRVSQGLSGVSGAPASQLFGVSQWPTTRVASVPCILYRRRVSQWC